MSVYESIIKGLSEAIETAQQKPATVPLPDEEWPLIERGDMQQGAQI